MYYYGNKNAHKSTKISFIPTVYCYMRRPTMWPSSGVYKIQRIDMLKTYNEITIYKNVRTNPPMQLQSYEPMF